MWQWTIPRMSSIAIRSSKVADASDGFNDASGLGRNVGQAELTVQRALAGATASAQAIWRVSACARSDARCAASPVSSTNAMPRAARVTARTRIPHTVGETTHQVIAFAAPRRGASGGKRAVALPAGRGRPGPPDGSHHRQLVDRLFPATNRAGDVSGDDPGLASHERRQAGGRVARVDQADRRRGAAVLGDGRQDLPLRSWARIP